MNLMRLSKPLLSAILLSIMIVSCSQQHSNEDHDQQGQHEDSSLHEESEHSESTQVYDAELAAQLQADDYGMKKYVFALLKAGPNRDQDSITRAQIQRGHLDNITRMAEAGQLVAAGPFMEEGEYQGIYVFNVETVEEALALTKTDPAVEAGRLEFEFYPWYSSATLQLIGDWHKKVAKVGI